MMRTLVNVESERGYSDTARMGDDQSIGARARELWQRSGLSMAALAKAMGYKASSGIQRYLDEGYDPARLPLDVAQKLATAIVGKGDPPIMSSEVFALAGIQNVSAPGVEAVPFDVTRETLPPAREMARDIPVYGTALGAPEEYTVITGVNEGDTVAVEQAMLDTSEAIEYLRRPPALLGRDGIYGVFISGSSMHPRFKDGEIAIVDSKRPPRAGDDVVVQLRGANGADKDRVIAVMIKTLVRRSASFVELEQYNPIATFRIDAERVVAVHRVIPWPEILAV